MEILVFVSLAGAGICALFCTILCTKHLHNYIGLWVGGLGAMFLVVTACAQIHSQWSKAEANTLPTQVTMPPAPSVTSPESQHKVPPSQDKKDAKGTQGDSLKTADKAAHYLKDPTPEHIKKTIDNSPPLARELVSKQFIGAPVAWDGLLRTGTQHGDGTTSIHLSSGLKAGWDGGYAIIFEADFPKHNFLLQMKKDSPLHVDGIIEGISVGSYVELKEVHVRVLDIA